MERTDLIVRELSTGHVMIFDTEQRDLFLVDREKATSLSDRSPAAARELAEQGDAWHLRRDDLQAITDALAEIVLLG